jgi:oligoribonuclease NrnB/cAMP/cGMP phosphodiesterase (DHH superfamily)
MYLFHLSHTDLDGYGCQLLTSSVYKKHKFYNANYGEEVSFRIDQILRDAEQVDGKVMILITDLNLNLNEAKKLDKKVKESDKEIELQLLDHHATGLECSELYEWYYLDTSRCATKITYDYLSEKKPKKINKHRWLKPMVDMINAIDIWKEQEKYFEFGKVCMRMISETRELSRFMFDEEHRDYKLTMLKWASKFLGKKNGQIKLDDSLTKLKKRYLRDDRDDILDNYTSRYIVSLLKSKKEQIKIFHKGKVGILTFQLGSISTIANEFLKECEDIDFVMDINTRGNCSFRSSGKIDLSLFAKEYFSGGGHPNASGGRFESVKDSYSYEAVKEKVEKYLEGVQNG